MKLSFAGFTDMAVLRDVAEFLESDMISDHDNHRGDWNVDHDYPLIVTSEGDGSEAHITITLDYDNGTPMNDIHFGKLAEALGHKAYQGAPWGKQC